VTARPYGFNNGLKGLTAGDEARTRDPYLGKVRLQFRIREDQKMALRRLLPRWMMLFDAELRRLTSSDDDLSVIGREHARVRERA
jgi:hypothetical protein